MIRGVTKGRSSMGIIITNSNSEGFNYKKPRFKGFLAKNK
jgi:hypothetical protein